MGNNQVSTNILNLDNLTPEQALQVQAKILGYKKMPVSIERFIEDDYYLGKLWKKSLYPYWKDKLKQIFPTPIHTAYPYVVFTGPIGTGKSTTTGIMALYNLHRLDCLGYNFNYFGVRINKGIDFVFFHTSTSRAQSILIDPLMVQMDESPYFQQEFKGLWETYNLRPEGLRSDASTGGDVLFYHFSEVNFTDYDRTKFRIDQAFSRLKSRFIKILGYFGNIVIDSSAAAEGSLVEDLIRDYPVDLLVIRDPIWEVKKSLGTYFITPDEDGNTSFKVFTGDGSVEPYIITKDKPLKDDCDPDKVIEVPNELKSDYESNIELALQNTAGIGTVQSDTFILDKIALRASFSIPNHISEVILVDFYDDDKLIDYIKAQIKEIPADKILCIGVDMGVSGDLCGFSASYFDDWIRDKEGKPTIEFKTVTPLSVAISRKPGQETRITKIYDLIKGINDLREVGLVVTDGYQSTQLRQDLDAAGIWCYLSSVDRTKDAYIFYKLQVYKGFHNNINHRLLFDEANNVVDLGYKIDHRSDKSKDVLDSMVNSLYNISLNTEFFSQISVKAAQKLQMKLFNEIRTPDQIVDDFLKNRRF